MRARWVGLLIFAVLLSATPVVGARAQNAGRAFTSQDAIDVRSVRVSDVTKDGRWIAATVQTRRDRANVDHFRFGDPTYVAPSLRQLMVVDAQSGESRAVLPDREQTRSETWSPDGRRLAFLRLVDDQTQLFLHEPASGRTSRVPVNSSKSIAASSSLLWSPDGTQLLLSLRPDGWAAEARTAFLALTEGPIVVQDSRDDFLDWDRVRGLDRQRQQALVRVTDGTVTELPLTSPLQNPTFGPDGSYLVFGESQPQKTSYERAKGTLYGVFQLTLAGGTVDTVIAPQERRINGAWNEQASAFAWTDRGNVFLRTLGADSARNLTEEYRVATSATDTSKLSFSLEQWRPDGGALLLESKQGYHLLNVASGAMERVFAFAADEETRPRRSIQHWSADGRYVYMSTSARDRWNRGLARLDLQSQQVEQLVSDANVYNDWNLSADGTRVVYRMSDGNRPDELYTSDTQFAQPRKLTTLNPQLADVALTRTELVEYRDVDGNTLYGVLYYPRGYEAGKKYPLVAEVYETFFDNGYNENMNLVTARGWFGFRPSVSLEVGYPGEAWIKGVPSAINTLIERGLVDEKQVGVYGQSYGGYAVNLLVTQTDRFSAAANVSGKVNIISFLGDSEKITTRNYNAAEEGQDRIGATLWEQPQKYIATSAVMFADRIETPLLLLSGEGDWNVPATNQREMYYALRRLGKEVMWVNYANGGHGAGRASSVEDFHDHWMRLLNWMGEHFEEAVADGEVVGQQ